MFENSFKKMKMTLVDEIDLKQKLGILFNFFIEVDILSAILFIMDCNFAGIGTLLLEKYYVYVKGCNLVRNISLSDFNDSDLSPFFPKREALTLEKYTVLKEKYSKYKNTSFWDVCLVSILVTVPFVEG